MNMDTVSPEKTLGIGTSMTVKQAVEALWPDVLQGVRCGIEVNEGNEDTSDVKDVENSVQSKDSSIRTGIYRDKEDRLIVTFWLS
jgi:ribose 5-phosphate isomerase